MAVSYRVLGTHLDLSKHSVSHAPIPLLERHSGEFIPPTVGSYGHADNTIIFRDGEAVTVTSNNQFPTTIRDYKRNGPVTQIDDYYFGHWINGGNENYPNREWNRPVMLDKASSVITSFGETRAQFYRGDTPLPKYVTKTYGQGPNNRFGKGIHHAGNLELDVMDFLRTHEGKELASH